MSKLVKVTDTYAVDASLIKSLNVNEKESIITVYIQGESSLISYIIDLSIYPKGSLFATFNLLIDNINDGRI